MWQPGFKVVYNNGSYCYEAYQGRYCYHYRSGQITERMSGCGPMAVFDSFAIAVLFLADDNGRNRLTHGQWCQEFLMEASRKGTTIIPIAYEESQDNELWNPNHLRRSAQSLPIGTKFADRVYVLEMADFGILTKLDRRVKCYHDHHSIDGFFCAYRLQVS